MDFDDSLKRWVNVLNKSEKYFKGAVIENREEILDLNTAQLEKGKDAEGNFLEQYALDSYAKFKQAIGSRSPFGVPDLKLEGDFHEGFKLLIEGNEFQITSTDSKSDDLEYKYGEDIFGLSKDSMNEVRPALLESWLKLLRNEL